MQKEIDQLKTSDDFSGLVDGLVIRLTAQKRMLNIDSGEIAYSSFRGLYEAGNGHGLQLSERLEHKRGEIIDYCDRIATDIYKLQDIQGV